MLVTGLLPAHVIKYLAKKIVVWFHHQKFEKDSYPKPLKRYIIPSFTLTLHPKSEKHYVEYN